MSPAVEVTQTMWWSDGRVNTLGDLVVMGNLMMTGDSQQAPTLDETELVNNGIFSITNHHLTMENGARITNSQFAQLLLEGNSSIRDDNDFSEVESIENAGKIAFDGSLGIISCAVNHHGEEIRVVNGSLRLSGEGTYNSSFFVDNGDLVLLGLDKDCHAGTAFYGQGETKLWGSLIVAPNAQVHNYGQFIMGASAGGISGNGPAFNDGAFINWGYFRWEEGHLSSVHFWNVLNSTLELADEEDKELASSTLHNDGTVRCWGGDLFLSSEVAASTVVNVNRWDIESDCHILSGAGTEVKVFLNKANQQSGLTGVLKKTGGLVGGWPAVQVWFINQNAVVDQNGFDITFALYESQGGTIIP